MTNNMIKAQTLEELKLSRQQYLIESRNNTIHLHENDLSRCGYIVVSQGDTFVINHFKQIGLIISKAKNGLIKISLPE